MPDNDTPEEFVMVEPICEEFDIVVTSVFTEAVWGKVINK